MAASGCWSSSNADDDDFELDDGDPIDNDEVVDPHSSDSISTEDLLQCADREDIDQSLAITFDFEISAHEMIACGGLVFGIVGALVEGIIELAENPNASTLPDGVEFDGEGTYFVQPATFDDLRMENRFYFGRDYEVGARGELITDNLFVMSSYLRSPQTTVDVSNFPEVRIEISHDGPGPLVELLGLGAEPPNPIVVGNSTLNEAQANLRDIEVESIIFFTDRPGSSTIEYSVDSPRMLAQSFLTGSPMALNMVNASGTGIPLDQELTVDVWGIEYDDGVGALNGNIDFTVRGGPFDYVSRFFYDGSGWPEISFACAE
ncbi:MAG: hypothetical protein AAF799_11310 [Myxococcota bacterium]